MKDIIQSISLPSTFMADQILEPTYARRFMDYFKLLQCLSIEILSVKIAGEKICQVLKLIDYLTESKFSRAPRTMCET